MKDESEAHITVIRELGIFGLKTLLTPNGGAVVVLLAFLGNVVGADGSNIPAVVTDFQSAVTAYLVGIFLSMASVFSTYLIAHFNLRYLHKAAESQVSLPFYLRPAVQIAAMVLPAFMGFAAFVIGSSFAISAFSP